MSVRPNPEDKAEVEVHGDTYVVTSGTDATSTQQSSTFLAPVTPGQQVCITVTVNRAGKNGPASAEKCSSATGSP